MKVTSKALARKRRHFRIRRKVSGTAQRPRLAVYLSNKHIYAQLIDDESHRTLVQASTREAGASAGHVSRETAEGIGRSIGERAVSQGINTVVFDRGGFKYGLRMKALADAAREAGLTL